MSTRQQWEDIIEEENQKLLQQFGGRAGMWRFCQYLISKAKNEKNKVAWKSIQENQSQIKRCMKRCSERLSAKPQEIVPGAFISEKGINRSQMRKYHIGRIKITTEIENENKVKVIDIAGILPIDQLPDEYVQLGSIHMWLNSECSPRIIVRYSMAVDPYDDIFQHPCVVLKVGYKYKLDTFKKILTFMVKAGNRLHEINKKLRAQKSKQVVIQI